MSCAFMGAVVVGLTACESEVPAVPARPLPDGLEVEILNPDRPAALRCNPEIRLGRKVSVDVLESLSRRLLLKEAKDCSFGFAAYYLPAMQPGSGAWAIADLGSEISVSILGLSASDEETLLRRAEAQGDTFGVWVDDTSYASVVSFHRDASGLKLTRWYLDGGGSAEPIRIVRKEHGFELRDAAATRRERHYRIGDGGDLETWDGVGFLSAARKVRVDVDLAALESEEAARRARRSRVASSGRSKARAAAAEERWRKFDEWLALYRGTLDAGRHSVLYLGAMRDAAEREAACGHLTGILAALPSELRAAPSPVIDIDPLLSSLDRLREACAGDLEIRVLLDAAAASAAWQKLDRDVEQVVSELRPEEE